MKIFYTCCLLLSAWSAWAQSPLTHEEALEDYRIFRAVLEQSHPSMYEFVSAEEWQQSFQATEAALAEGVSDVELYRQLCGLADQVHDGHLQVFGPPSLDIAAQYFPLIVKVIDDRLFVDAEGPQVALGSELLAINGHPVAEILPRLYKYAPTDGLHRSRTLSEIDLKFGVFWSYEFGSDSTFEVVAKAPARKVDTFQLPAEPFEKVRYRNAERASYGARFHGFKDPLVYFKERINPQEPFVYHIDSLDAAVLVVNSFGIPVRAFKSQLVGIFKQLKKQKTRHLIVDVRQNEGGFRPNVVHLFSFLARESFRQRDSCWVKTLDLPHPEAITRTFLNPDTFLVQAFGEYQMGDRWLRGGDEMEAIMKPHKYAFRGKIQLLTSGRSFSAASTLAYQAKAANHLQIVGEETGGGYVFHHGDFPVYY
ncbi:MAG: S41 family peptidase, partial [Bacteroidota bacterium]